MTDSKPNGASKSTTSETAPAVKAEAANRAAAATAAVKDKPADAAPASTPAPVAKTEAVPVKPAPAAKTVAAAPAAKAVTATPARPTQSAVVKAAEPKAAKKIVKKKAARRIPAVAKPAVTKSTVTIKKGMNDMTNKIETEIKKNAEAATAQGQAMLSEMSNRSKSAVEKGNKMMEQIVDLAKGNVEAFVVSSRVAAKGAEELTREAAEFGRKRVETATATMKSFASAKSPTEVFQLQSDYAKGAFDSMVAETSKMSEAWLKIAGDVFAPITSRYAVAADKIKQVAA